MHNHIYKPKTLTPVSVLIFSRMNKALCYFKHYNLLLLLLLLLLLKYLLISLFSFLICAFHKEILFRLYRIHSSLSEVSFPSRAVLNYLERTGNWFVLKHK